MEFKRFAIAPTAADTFTALISTDSVDLDREVLLRDGLDSEAYDRRRPVFWNHDYDRGPIGKGTGPLRLAPRGWDAPFAFIPRPATHPAGVEWWPDTCKSFAALGLLGASVGLDRIDYRAPTYSDRMNYGDGVERVVTRWALLEWSVTPMPTNQDTVVEAVRKGLVTRAQCKSVLGVDVRGSKVLYLIGQRRKARKVCLVIL